MLYITNPCLSEWFLFGKRSKVVLERCEMLVPTVFLFPTLFSVLLINDKSQFLAIFVIGKYFQF